MKTIASNYWKLSKVIIRVVMYLCFPLNSPFCLFIDVGVVGKGKLQNIKLGHLCLYCIMFNGYNEIVLQYKYNQSIRGFFFLFLSMETKVHTFATFSFLQTFLFLI